MMMVYTIQDDGMYNDDDGGFNWIPSFMSLFFLVDISV